LQNLQDVFFLQTNGSGVLSFSSPSAGSFVFLGETSASNATSASLNGFFTSDYDVYKILVLGVLSATNSQPLYIRFATTGSYTEQSSGYLFSATYTPSSAGVTYEYGTGQSQIRTNQVMSSTAGAQCNFDMTLYNPNRGDQYKTMTWNCLSQDADITNFSGVVGAGSWKNTTAITGIKFFAASGNLYATKIKIYGVKNT
jgi:hypothetical protein